MSVRYTVGLETEKGSARSQQRRGSSRTQERAPHRGPGRNPRPLQRRPALPHGRAQRARRHHHLLEYRPSRRSGRTTETRRTDHPARSPGPHLTPWVGPHPAHRRIPVAKTWIAALAHDSAPYRNRTACGCGVATGRGRDGGGLTRSNPAGHRV